MKKKNYFGFFAVIALWLSLAVTAWCKSPDAVSEAERRSLAQFPADASVLSGEFMGDFESYALDQFPFRDGFRRIKAEFHYNVLRQGDNNGIYIAGGHAAKLEYPLNQTSVANAAAHFSGIYEDYLKDSGSKAYFSIVPDKGYYLAQANGYPAMDYAALFEAVEEAAHWATFVDITDTLSADDYYRTDTHWRQERLLAAAEKLCDAMGVEAPDESDYTQTAVEKPFYGVYYGQAALPMEAETLYIMESELLKGCTVYNHETGAHTAVYDMEKLDSRDLYDVFLSGAAALLTIENPAGEPGRELIVFRDSFGSSLTPLLVQGYERVTLVDTRYIARDLLGEYVDFHGQDVLFLYSTSVINNSSTLK